jgi:hypothetical protein
VEKECGRNKLTIPMDEFPSLSRKLNLQMKEHGQRNLLVEFRKCGIIPLHSLYFVFYYFIFYVLLD